MSGERLSSALYTGTVFHRRTRPKPHRLSYSVYAFLLDLDELPHLEGRIAGFRYNRWGLLAFYDRDYGPGENAPLRPWIERQLTAAGIDLAGGPIRLLCYPRVLGYVFNPLSVYYCYRKERTGEPLAAICYEVTNTFGQRHTYVIPVAAGNDGVVRQSCAKTLYVSPFIDMDMTYHFRLQPPGAALALAIRTADRAGTLLFASFNGRRQALTSAGALRAFCSLPMLTLKVIGGIHWEALKLWLKGIPLVRRPRPPSAAVTIVSGTEWGASAVQGRDEGDGDDRDREVLWSGTQSDRASRQPADSGVH